MNKVISFSCVVLLQLFVAKNAAANCEGLKCQGVTNTYIQSLKTTNKSIFLTFPAGVNAALNCELQQGAYASLDTKSPNFSSTHSLLLTAIASNAPLVVEFDATNPFCQVSSVEILVSE